MIEFIRLCVGLLAAAFKNRAVHRPEPGRHLATGRGLRLRLGLTQCKQSEPVALGEIVRAIERFLGSATDHVVEDSGLLDSVHGVHADDEVLFVQEFGEFP